LGNNDGEQVARHGHAAAGRRFAALAACRTTPTLTRMFRSTVICRGLTEAEAREAVIDMLSEFEHRPWQLQVVCEWRDGVLRLSAQNEVDSTGMALLDEFCNAVTAYINYAGEIHAEVESVVKL
jgi:ABC-type transporter Mla MlaB component